MNDGRAGRRSWYGRQFDRAARIYLRVQRDRVSLIAGGVTFYFLLSLFPGLGAFVAIFGYFADIHAIVEQLAGLGDIVPVGGLDMIRRQLLSLAAQDKEILSLGFLIGFTVAFWTANNGIKALFQALNVAHGIVERRSFLRINLMAFAFTFGTMFIAFVLVAVVGIVPAALALFGRPGGLPETVIDLLRWPMLMVLSFVAITIVYRFGPNRKPASRRWISLGAILATVVWLAASAGFSYYLRNFADYNATYGSLGAVIGFLLWTWLSTVIVIVGAVIDAEQERNARAVATAAEFNPRE